MNLHRKEKVILCGVRNKKKSEEIIFQINCIGARQKQNCIIQEGSGWGQCLNKSKVEIMLIRRNYNQAELDVAMLKNMTGMSVTWQYSENVVSLKQSHVNEDFIKLANAYNKLGKAVDLWTKIKEIKVNSLKEK